VLIAEPAAAAVKVRPALVNAHLAIFDISYGWDKIYLAWCTSSADIPFAGLEKFNDSIEAVMLIAWLSHNDRAFVAYVFVTREANGTLPLTARIDYYDAPAMAAAFCRRLEYATLSHELGIDAHAFRLLSGKTWAGPVIYEKITLLPSSHFKPSLPSGPMLQRCMMILTI
jgi:hypothetical protein